jgi:hypothetical protein
LVCGSPRTPEQPAAVTSPQDIEVRLRQTGIEELTIELRPAVLEEVAA